MPCFISVSLSLSGGKSVCAQTPDGVDRRANARGKQTQPTVPARCDPALCAYKVSTQQAPLAIVPISVRARDIDGGITLEHRDPWLGNKLMVADPTDRIKFFPWPVILSKDDSQQLLNDHHTDRFRHL